MGERKWYHYRPLFPQREDMATGRIVAIEKRLADVEQRLVILEGRPMTDQVQNVYYHRDEYTGDMAGTVKRLPPWVSTSVRFAESLTSPAFVKTTFLESGVLGLSFAALGALVSWRLELPWIAPILIGLTGAALSGGILVLWNRTELHRVITQQANRKRQTEMRVQISKYDERFISAEFLYLNARIEPEQLRQFARASLAGANLSVHNWVGQGALFSRGQYDSLMAELERMDYVVPGAGNQARRLTSKGRALMRAWADPG